jgi:hypothetical protein
VPIKRRLLHADIERARVHGVSRRLVGNRPVTESALIRIMCPNLSCQRVLVVPEAARGKVVRCRVCGMNIRIPAAKGKDAPAKGKDAPAKGKDAPAKPSDATKESA